MSSLMLVVVFVVLPCVVLGAGFLSLLAAQRRREEISASAARRGWQYAVRDDHLTTRFSGDPFGRGHDRRAENVLSGAHDGRGFVAFDYRYSTTETSRRSNGSTHRRTLVHRFAVVALDLGVQLPELSVTPEGSSAGRSAG